MVDIKTAITPDEFEEMVRKEKFSPACLCFGTDSFLMREMIKKLELKLSSPKTAGFNLEVFYADQTPADEVVNSCKTAPMLGGNKFVIVKQFEKYSSTEKQILIQYLKTPSKGTVLIILWETEEKVVKDMLKALDAPKLLLVKFDPVRGEALARAIERWAMEYGKKIEREAIELLVEILGEDPGLIKQNLEKCCLYLGTEEELIKEETVSLLTTGTKLTSIDELVNAIFERNLERALRHYKTILEQKDELIVVLGVLRRHLEILWDLKNSPEPDKVFSSYKVFNYRSKNRYNEHAQLVKKAEIKTAFQILTKLDKDLKSSSTDKELLFEKALFELCLR